jgi:splicing factor 4
LPLLADYAQQLTEMGRGKHFLGDFLPPEELTKFLETFKAMKEGREPDLSDYKDFKLTCENVGFQMLSRMGWEEGAGLGARTGGILNPVDKGAVNRDGAGLGASGLEGGSRNSYGLTADDDEYSAYRKRMMLAYKFRPNPLNNPRRPYY